MSLVGKQQQQQQQQPQQKKKHLEKVQLFNSLPGKKNSLKKKKKCPFESPKFSLRKIQVPPQLLVSPSWMRAETAEPLPKKGRMAFFRAKAVQSEQISIFATSRV